MSGAPAPVHELTLQLPSPLEELADDRLAAHGVRVLLKRDDLINPEILGNKWRKLKYNIQAARDEGHSVLLTFGGAYSNHIRAVAAAGYYFGFSTIGVIRGEEHQPLNPSLSYAEQRGMRLTYMDRATYRTKHDQAVIDDLRARFGNFYLVPEGGSNALALRGCAELATELDADFDVVCCAVGTGGTLAGVSAALPPGTEAIGFPVLKGGDFLADDVRRLQRAYGKETSNWSVETGFHFGGFARRTKDLDDFIDDFRDRHGIQLDWVYVGKMMYGLFSLVERGRFEPGTKIVAVITG